VDLFDGAQTNFSISGLTISGGNTTGLGGAITFDENDTNVVLDSVILTGNSSAQVGGAIASVAWISLSSATASFPGTRPTAREAASMLPLGLPS
jgi:hypothetical protein